MSLCPKCKINVLDDAVMCPLCHSVLEREAGNEAIEESKSLMYPDISLKMKRSLLAIRITILASVVAEAICILVNYLTYEHVQFRWSLLTALGLLYGCFSLVVSGTRNRSHRRKIVVQLGVWLILLTGVDYTLGFRGWSVSIGYPVSIMATLFGVGILMIVRRRSWHSYLYVIIWLLLYSLLSLIPAFLIKVITFRLLNVIAALVSVTVLAALIIVGDRKAENELKRRFHV